MTWKPFHFLVVAIAGWMNRQQQQVIESHPRSQQETSTWYRWW
jgi:hypothetical protein